MRTAIVMIAHGSRRGEANAELRELSRQVGEHFPADVVAPAFLELAEPSIPAAVRSCLDGGAERVVMFPYFLSSGVHVAHDLEGCRQQLADEFPGVEFVLARPLGAHPGVLRLVLELLAEGADGERTAGESGSSECRSG